MKSQSQTAQKIDSLDLVDVNDHTCADIQEQVMRELAKKQNMQHLGRRLKRRGRGANLAYTMPIEYVNSELPDPLTFKTPEIRKMIERMDRGPWHQPELGQQAVEDFEYDYVVFSGIPGYGREYVCLWDTDTDTPFVITPTYELWQLEVETYGVVDTYQDSIVKNSYVRIRKDFENGVTNKALHWDLKQYAFECHLKGNRA